MFSVSARSSPTSSRKIVPFFFNDTATTEIYTLSLHDALPICGLLRPGLDAGRLDVILPPRKDVHRQRQARSEEHTSELQSRQYLVCRLLLEKKTMTPAINGRSTECLLNHSTYNPLCTPLTRWS